jgi:SAM-dependent methyltransferase
MQYSFLDRTLRKIIPSVAAISFNPVVKAIGDAIAYVLSFPFVELRTLPPNHLRIRVGVGNRIFTNHIHHLQVGTFFWQYFLAREYCKSNSDVVELGCGCGRVAAPLRDDWFEGTYVGVDIDQEMIEYCRQTFSAQRFRFVLSPHSSKTYSSGQPCIERRLDLGPSESKDFVFSVSLYSHLLEPQAAEYLVESFRILRPGGLMFSKRCSAPTLQRSLRSGRCSRLDWIGSHIWSTI